jgi:hypothetical protein
VVKLTRSVKAVLLNPTSPANDGSPMKKHFDRAGVRAPVQTWQQLPMPGADSPAVE